MEHGPARHGARAEERDLLGSASQRGLHHTLQQKQAAAAAAAAAAWAHLTVTPQLANAASSSVCKGLPTAFSQALDQKVPEDMRLQAGRKGGQGGAECEVAVHTTFQLCGSFRQGEVLQNGLLLHPRDPRILSSGPPPPPPPPATTCPTGAHGTVLELQPPPPPPTRIATTTPLAV
jgi:hypothetical protein